MMAFLRKAEPEFWVEEGAPELIHSRLRPLFLKRPACKAGPWLTSMNLDGKWFPVLVKTTRDFPEVLTVACCA